MEKCKYHDYLISNGFEEGNVAYTKHIRNKYNIDFTYFPYVHEHEIRVFFNDWCNWFKIDNEEHLKCVIEYYQNRNYDEDNVCIPTEDVLSLGFEFNESNYKYYRDNYGEECARDYKYYCMTKDFGNFRIDLINRYYCIIRIGDSTHHDYVYAKEQLEELIEFYKKVL